MNPPPGEPWYGFGFDPSKGAPSAKGVACLNKWNSAGGVRITAGLCYDLVPSWPL